MKTYWIFLGLICSLLSVNRVLAVTAEDLNRMLEAEENITLVDVRYENDYATQHIPGAINIPALACRIKNLPPLGRIIVYGDGVDTESTRQAAFSLNQKPGIAAQILEGGWGRWQTLNYPMVVKRGMTREELPSITYDSLVSIFKQHTDLVFVDLRRSPDDITSTRRTAAYGDMDEGALHLKIFSDIHAQFPGATVVSLPFSESKTAPGHKSILDHGNSSGKGSHCYVLIDNCDGAAEETARRMKASGIHRFVILAGGEKILNQKGKSDSQTLSGGNP